MQPTVRNGKWQLLCRALILFSVPRANRAFSFRDVLLFHALARGFRQIKYLSVVIDSPYRRYGTALLMIVRARLLESCIRAYAVTFDREIFDDATECVIKHTANVKKKKKNITRDDLRATSIR